MQRVLTIYNVLMFVFIWIAAWSQVAWWFVLPRIEAAICWLNENEEQIFTGIILVFLLLLTIVTL